MLLHNYFMCLTSSCFCIDGGSVSLSVGSGSSLNESCGICGTQSGELVYLNGTAATNPAEQQSVVESYRIPAAEMSLRPIRPECGEDIIAILTTLLYLCGVVSSMKERHNCIRTSQTFISFCDKIWRGNTNGTGYLYAKIFSH